MIRRDFSIGMIIILTKLCFLLILQTATPLYAQSSGIEMKEYKLLIKPGKFKDYNNLENDVDTFLEEVANFISANYDTAELAVAFDLEDLEMQEIKFFDTKDHQLRANGFTLSEEIELEKSESGVLERDDKAKYTLAYGTAGEQFAQLIDLSVKQFKEFKIRSAPEKFEEHISPANSIFSRSITARFRPEVYSMDTAWKAANIFPVLATFLDLRLPLMPVSNFVVTEHKFAGEIEFDPDHYAEFKLHVWSFPAKSEPPEISLAEFSMEYEMEELLGSKLPQYADLLFKALQKTEWYAPNLKTKMDFIYQSPVN